MAIFEIHLPKHTEGWFEACAHIFFEGSGCKPLKKRRYLRVLHIATLLGMTYKDALAFIMSSQVIHGFLYREEVYVHPSRFIKLYMDKVITRINTEWNEIPYSETIH